MTQAQQSACFSKTWQNWIRKLAFNSALKTQGKMRQCAGCGAFQVRLRDLRASRCQDSSAVTASSVVGTPLRHAAVSGERRPRLCKRVSGRAQDTWPR